MNAPWPPPGLPRRFAPRLARWVTTASLACAGIVAPVGLVPIGTGTVRANPALETLGGLGTSHPFTARLMGTGAETAYFNPALLPYVDEGFSIGFFLLSDQLDVSLAPRPAGADVTDAIYKAWQKDAEGVQHPLSFRPLPTATLGERDSRDEGKMRSYINVGFVKRIIKERCVVGLMAVLPTSTFQEQTSRFADEREQFFSNGLAHELYGDRLGMMTVTLGFGGVITDWLSWGAGFTLGLSTTTVNPVYVPDAANQREILITTDTGVDTTFAPHFSVTVTPSDRVRLAATLHTASKSETRGTNRLKFWNYKYEEGEDAIVQTFKFVNGYEPLTIGSGASLRFPNADGSAWAVGTELRWRAWSDYVDRSGKHPDVAWSDTVSASLGGRYESAGTSVHVDLGWTPSPVPNQGGAENYVDEDRIGVSAGLETDLDLLGVKLRGAIGLQVHRLIPRQTKKSDTAAFPVRDEFPDDAFDVFTGESFPDAVGLQTNNPGWPGWSSSGWLLGAGVSVKVGL